MSVTPQMGLFQRPPGAFRLRAIVVCALAVLVLAPGASARPDKEEMAKLEKGEILVRDASVKGPDGVQRLRGQAVALIDAPPEAVWRVITDHPHFPEFMPGVVHCEIVEDTGTARLVAYGVKVKWMSISYHLRLRYDHDTFHVEYALDPSFPHDVSDAQGTWDLRPLDDGKRTRVVYSVYLDSGRFVPRFIERYLSKRQLPEILENVRSRAISGGKWKIGDPRP